MPTSKTLTFPIQAVVLGELLIDLYAEGGAWKQGAHLVPRSGGAPANVARHLARAGIATALITAIGDDALGGRALQTLSDDGVDTSRVRRRSGMRTGLTLVDVAADGERSFTPWRDGSADLSLREDEIGSLRGARLLQHGTVSLLRDPARRATLRAVAEAHRAGAWVCVDLNLRRGMFPSDAALRRVGALALRSADVVKATVDEAAFLGGSRPSSGRGGPLFPSSGRGGPLFPSSGRGGPLFPSSGRGGPLDAARAFVDGGARLALVTDGARPVAIASAVAAVSVRPPRLTVVDSTGAGDAFFASVLANLASSTIDPRELAAPELTRLGEAACAAGAQACMHLGALGDRPSTASG